MIFNARKWILLFSFVLNQSYCSRDGERLFIDLLQKYNPLVRPVANHTKTMTVKLFLKLSMLLDIHEKNQIMTTNMWIRQVTPLQEWTDDSLKWDPADYDGIEVMYFPPDMIWKPDIVLYNNADGNPAVTMTMSTKAVVRYNGEVMWDPPATYRSFCPIDVKWFPYDEQTCFMKFGTWSYDGSQIDLEHWRNDSQVVSITSDHGSTQQIVENGLDLSDYHQSHEWSIMTVPAIRNSVIYPCCDVPFIDITLKLHLRRKPLFYTINLMAPSVGLAFLTGLVFHLPADSWEKVTLSISILIAITVFFLMLVELIPATSVAIPLLARYLLFTLLLVSISVIVTALTVDIHWRKATATAMPQWMHKFVLEKLPPLLGMKPLDAEPVFALQKVVVDMVEKCLRKDINVSRTQLGMGSGSQSQSSHKTSTIAIDDRRQSIYNPHMVYKRMVEHNKLAATRYLASSVALIAHKLRRQQIDEEAEEKWKYAARIIDRIMLVVFSCTFCIGTLVFILQTPAFYDTRKPIA